MHSMTRVSPSVGKFFACSMTSFTDLCANSRSMRYTNCSSCSLKARLVCLYMVSRVWKTSMLRRNSPRFRLLIVFKSRSMYTHNIRVTFFWAIQVSSRSNSLRALDEPSGPTPAMSATGLNSRVTNSMSLRMSSSLSKRSAAQRTKLLSRFRCTSISCNFVNLVLVSMQKPKRAPVRAPKLPPAAIPMGPKGKDMIPRTRPPPRAPWSRDFFFGFMYIDLSKSWSKILLLLNCAPCVPCHSRLKGSSGSFGSIGYCVLLPIRGMSKGVKSRSEVLCGSTSADDEEADAPC
mmetsp:Transcript_36070/g.76958  ORF Transcript_36070/g.76958 Transcript_36070/m.76958 type:complete len:290 (-) Transcript_36070:158-1027(-)